MKRTLCIIGLAIVMGLAIAYISVAATYYMGGPGDNFSSFREAFRGPNAMKGGDTLIIRDGFYDGTDNQYCPPSGTPENYTIIKAEHDAKAVFGVGMSLSSPYGPGASYVQYEGIKYVSGGGTGEHHFKFLRCIFEGHVPDGNTVTVATGWNQDHILFEDCVAYGKGRYKFLIYGTQYVVLRRCIARMDYANATWSDTEMKHEQIAGFSIYTAENVELQNCMVIDSDQPQFLDNMAPARDGFYGPKNPVNVKLRGCIGLNNPALYTGCTVPWPDTASENCVFWGHGILGVAIGGIDHNTISDFSSTGESRGIMGCGAPLTAYNNIVTGASIGLYETNSKHNLLWDNLQNYSRMRSTEGDITDVNPFYHPTENPQGGLKYLVRIEPNSNLSGKATDGGDIGANILKRIGRSGTLWGEPGWNEVTNEDLWPWPNEDLIKEHMGNYNRGGVDPNLPRGDRGFCAYVSPFGSPNTLTSYIWEYLGNPIPPEIYGQNPNPNSPPIAYDQQVETNENIPVAITLAGSDSDGDPLTYTVISNPSNGSLSGTAPNLTYTPNPDFSGDDLFTFKVNDGVIDSNTATVSITVKGRPGKPIHVDLYGSK